MHILFVTNFLLILIGQFSICELRLQIGKSLPEDFFNHANIQGSSWRTTGYEEVNDPKNLFFSAIYSNEETTKTDDPSAPLTARVRRQTDEQIDEAGTVKMDTVDEEVSTLKVETENQDTLQISTESAPLTTEIGNDEEYTRNFIPINDFIRFRRELLGDNQEKTVGSDGGSTSKIQNQNFELGLENFDVQNNRGPRGLSTQQWVKFPYQVQINQKSDDSFASPSDFTKPRRVQFITQKRFQVENPSVSSNSRQGRVSDQPRQSDNQPREPRLENDIRKNPPLFTPRFRDFDASQEYPFRFSRGRYYERDLMDRRPDFRSLDVYPRNRRIIYYANLPEITRESPRFNEMGRFREYRDPFEDRYSGGQYRRGFYRDRMNEDNNPLKVSTDVNVRDVKKNPEKRIYSDVKRKYGYDAHPFDSDQPMRH